MQEEDNSLHLVQGFYGVWDNKRGFSRLTNFFMEPVGFISSKRLILKGKTPRASKSDLAIFFAGPSMCVDHLLFKNVF